MTKTCTKCKTEKPLTDFYKDSAAPDGKRFHCKGCQKIFANRWKVSNPDYAATKAREFKANNPAYFKDWYDSNLSDIKVKSAAWKDANRGRMKETNAALYKRHPERYYIARANRRASELGAMPKWANTFYIGEIYKLAKLRTQKLGMKFEVDHIVPLQSPLVCGLHVESNLQIISQRQNRTKHNFYWPDMPSEVSHAANI